MSGTDGLRKAFNAYSLRKQRVAAVFSLFLAFALASFGLHAELLFRSIEQVNGEQRWSSVKRYANPSDTAYPRAFASAVPMPADEVRVILSGEITLRDVDSAAVMARLVASGKQKISGNAVWLASNGGDIDAGMDIGRLLRRMGLFTVVGKSDRCLSACVFVLMGGERRIAAGPVGIHRPFFPFTEDTPDRPAKFKHLQRTLKAYIEELDFPDSLYEAMMLVPPETMQVVGAADLKRFYLDGISPSSEDRADALSARRLNLPMAEYLKQKARTPACALLIAGNGRCETKTQEAAASGGAIDDPGGVQKSGAASAGRAVGNSTGNAEGAGTTRDTPRSTRVSTSG